MAQQKQIICNKVEYLDRSTFIDSLRKMRASGGAKQRAAEKVMEIIGSVESGLGILAKMTKNKDKRIEGCMKYDLPGACRLVTEETDGVICLLFVGDHEEEERFLRNNRGRKLIAAKEAPNKIETTRIHVPQEGESMSSCGVVTDENKPMLQRFSFSEFEELIPQKKLQRDLLSINEDTPQEEIFEVAELIPDTQVRDLIFDLIVLCREGNYRGAKVRLKEHRGETIDLIREKDALEKAIVSGENSDTFIDFAQLSKEEVERLLDPEKFQDWMLYLHPDQKEMVDRDFDLPAVLKGVSGSGKTVILIHRARRLTQKYPDQRIRILTLNRSLAKLLRKLINDLCLSGEEKRIEVDAYYDYFQKISQYLGTEEYLSEYIRSLPHNHPMQVVLSQALKNHKDLANDYDPVGRETLNDTWREFWTDHANREAHTLSAKQKLLESIDGNFDKEAYIRDEFTLVRSAFPRDKRTTNRGDDYYSYSRSGRCIPFRETERRSILSLLLRYEEFMFAGAMLDEAGLAQIMMPHISRLNKLPPELSCRCLLIDEYQDFSTLELRLLKQIPTERENGLFLTGDTAQKVMVKDFNLSTALLDKNYVKTPAAIKKNYRNSRQILEAAHQLIASYSEEVSKIDKSIEIINPDYAVRETSKPLAIKTNSQLDTAWNKASEWIDSGVQAWAVCIVTCDAEKLPIQNIIRKCPHGINAGELSGDYSDKTDTVSVGYLSDVKGLEFSAIIIVGASAELFPNPGIPKDEQWREALRLYVAITRGRDQVSIIYEGFPSFLLDKMNDFLLWKTEEVDVAAAEATVQKKNEEDERQIDDGLIRCPYCNCDVSAKNLKKHQRKKCPNSPKNNQGKRSKAKKNPTHRKDGTAGASSRNRCRCGAFAMFGSDTCYTCNTK